ncbi:uncharacterized protein MYCFIDRAFT_169085 [Pseudocercospora fijiensis CIRAD86]|uniref:Uncharacterized protein n=1 Tax=Pseudocercospora fijiensis (strain CIRAD86) TaxID=383855 RepID=N1Q8I1_PSEFD|nr:uncharacterized protein MYCFIDRAFT_169085 [Pseudocercospora fijiensis CIRAD86]EME87232.1 hypothetical protein MYCFIDRAFT_169085 [Pseudocercospora fijiensis CIRAD86]
MLHESRQRTRFQKTLRQLKVLGLSWTLRFHYISFETIWKTDVQLSQVLLNGCAIAISRLFWVLHLC